MAGNINTIYDPARGLFQVRTNQTGSMFVNSVLFVEGEAITGDSVLSASNLAGAVNELSGNVDVIQDLVESGTISLAELSASYVLTSGTVDTLVVASITSLALDATLSSSVSELSQSHIELSSSYELLSASYLLTSGVLDTLDSSALSASLAELSASYLLTSASHDDLSSSYELLSSSYLLTSGVLDTLLVDYSLTSASYDELSSSYELLSASYLLTSGVLDTLDSSALSASLAELSASYLLTSASHDDLSSSYELLSSSYLLTSGVLDTLLVDYSLTSASYDELSSSYELLSSSYVLTSGTVDSLGGGTSVAGIVEIFEKADFPTSIGGVINLTASFLYQIKDNIDLGTDVLQGSDISLVGLATQNASIITAGTGALLENDSNGYIVINDLVLSNSVGSILDVGLDTHSASHVNINRSILDCGKVGNIGAIDGGHNLVIRATEFVDYVDGLVLSGVFEQIKIGSSLFTSAEAVTSSSAYGLKFDDDFFCNETLIHGTNFTTTNPGDIALDISSVISSSGDIEEPIAIHNCVLRGSGTSFSDLDETNLFVDVVNSLGVPSSTACAQIRSDGLDENFGLDTGVRVKIDVDGTTIQNSGHFTHNGNMELTYVGMPTKNFMALFTGIVQRDTSNNSTVILQIAVNDITIARMRGVALRSVPVPVSLPAILLKIETGDTIALYIDNPSSNDDASITDITLTVSEI